MKFQVNQVIKNINIKSFKSIIDMDVELSNLTLLAGLNNSGKSSIIQAIRMYIASSNGHTPLLDGHGGINNLRSDFVSNTQDISFELTFEDNTVDVLVLSSSNNSLNPKKCPEFFYVGADRLGPQPNLPLNVSLDSNIKIGDKGEYVFDFITKLNNSGFLIPDSLIHEKSQGKTFEYVLEAWLSEISPGVKFTFETNQKADTSYAEINNYRPSNVGFGLSYTLPIIAATLGAASYSNQAISHDDWLHNWENSKNQNGILIVLENPEAHLHPKGQTAMGRLVALAASCGVQILVETHSEHVMDGIRIAVKEQLLSNELVKFHYLSKDDQGKSIIDTPNLDSEGKVDRWPEGFFDQTLKNRSILAKRAR